MYKIARAPQRERSIIFENTAAKYGINAAIVEKDFWVCFTLDYIFHHSPWASKVAFKGGTSLSKAYGLIERFSEDIDLILDWRVLGYRMYEPWEERSKTKQQQFIDSAHEREEVFLKESFAPYIQKELTDLLGQNADVYYFKDEAQQPFINFEYPCEFTDASILRAIRLEVGALAAWTPTQKTIIHSYVADQYPNIFEKPETAILTTTPERTFWEKATILHQEAQRPEGKEMPPRYSRHYYDFVSMARKGVLDKALEKPDLLAQVADFKNKFYPRRWTHYEAARIGTLKLSPQDSRIEELKRDYKEMRSMIYGYYPEFNEILEMIAEIEHKINNQ